jgi:hypothetical protein
VAPDDAAEMRDLRAFTRDLVTEMERDRRGVAEPGGIALSEDAYHHVKRRLDVAVRDLAYV